MRKALDAFDWTGFWVIIVVVFVGNQLFNAAENLFLFLAVGLGLMWIYRETCRVLFFRPILRNCARTPDRLGFVAARDPTAGGG